MIRSLTAAIVAAAALTGLAGAQIAGQAGPGQGPLDISADDGEVFDEEGRLVYTGDVNVVRGETRLRADRVEAFFDRRAGRGFSELVRIIATGDVYYVTATDIARGDRGVYDLEANTIELTGSVVLTQGCNVSTGNRLVADLDSGSARLSGGGEGDNQRVRSVFFTDEGAEEEQQARDCPPPAIPGNGPRPFPED